MLQYALLARAKRSQKVKYTYQISSEKEALKIMSYFLPKDINKFDFVIVDDDENIIHSNDYLRKELHKTRV